MKHEPVVKGTYGQTIRVNTTIDLSLFTAVYLRFRKPGTSAWIEKTGQKYSSTYIDYLVLENDDLFDTAGEVKVTAKAESSSQLYISAKAGIIPVVEEGDL